MFSEDEDDDVKFDEEVWWEPQPPDPQPPEPFDLEEMGETSLGYDDVIFTDFLEQPQQQEAIKQQEQQGNLQVKEKSLEEMRRKYEDIAINDRWVIETNKYNKDVEDVINLLKNIYFMKNVKYKYFNTQKMIAVGGKVHAMDIYRNGVEVAHSLQELIQYIQNDIIKAIDTEIAETFLVLPEVKNEGCMIIKYHEDEQYIFLHSALDYLSKKYAGRVCVLNTDITNCVGSVFMYSVNEDKVKTVENFWNIFYNCMYSQERFIVINLVIICENEHEGHANILLYDKVLHAMERFEPNGKIMNICTTINIDQNILDFFTQGIFQLDIEKYYCPLNVCPAVSFQFIQNLELEEKQLLPSVKDPDGFCTYWSIWYVELRLSNPEKDIEKLQKEAINLLVSKRVYGQDSFTDFIRRYTAFLHSYHKTSVDELGGIEFGTDYETGYNKAKDSIVYDVYKLKDIPQYNILYENEPSKKEEIKEASEEESDEASEEESDEESDEASEEESDEESDEESYETDDDEE